MQKKNVYTGCCGNSALVWREPKAEFDIKSWIYYFARKNELNTPPTYHPFMCDENVEDFEFEKFY